MKAFIDLSDQMSAYAPYLKRTLKWYRRLALDIMLGTSMVNAFIMYNANIGNNKISVVDFRRQVAEELLYPSVVEAAGPRRSQTTQAGTSGRTTAKNPKEIHRLL